MAIVNARPEAPRTLSAQCEIRLTDADSASVRLSGALASAPEGLRVQLWKFGQDALDMLATDAGVWATGRAADDLGEHGLPDAWRALTHRLMVGALPDDCDTLVRSGPTFQCAGSWTSESVSAEGRIAGGTIIIDARTLVPVRVEATAGEVPVMIAFDRHVLIDGRPYPRRITVAAGPRSVEIRLHDIRPGATLSDAVFRVPAGARRIGASMPPPSER